MDERELTRRLRDADPVAREPQLTDFESAVMRQRVVLVAPGAETRHVPSWKSVLAIATVAAIAITGTLFDSRAERSFEHASSSAASEATSTVRMQTPTTQVQFQTPGGTRIVWTINPDLSF